MDTVKNEKLVKAMAYTDDYGAWFMELKYQYEDEKGVHERYYPKVEFPFSCGKLPTEVFSSDRSNWLGISFVNSEVTISLPYSEVAAFRGTFQNPANGQIIKDVCSIDNLIKPAVREMTVEEIEKELGYKVRVIGKEKK